LNNENEFVNLRVKSADALLYACENNFDDYIFDILNLHFDDVDVTKMTFSFSDGSEYVWNGFINPDYGS